MARLHFTFACSGETLLATLDEAPGDCALMIVTGGNETRAGAWDGQAKLATRIAQAGWPVLRFDRRGVADSEGENREFTGSAQDIAAALAALRAQAPQVRRVIGLGNCDGAAALMLAQGAGCDGLILSNPWTIEDGEGAADRPAEVTRAHYRQRLRDPAALKRLLTGKVSLAGLARSLLGLLHRQQTLPVATSLAGQLAAGIAGFHGPIRFLVAERDRTGQTFLARWNKADPRIRRCPDATHSYVEPHAQDWLFEQVAEALSGLS